MQLLLTCWPLAVMAVDWVAVARGRRSVEYAAKPGAMVALLVWLGNQAGPFQAWPIVVVWFALGLLLSLAGDILLLFDDAYFLLGLVAFLLAQAAYVIGFHQGGLVLPWEVILLVPVGLAGGWLAWRVGAALKARHRDKLIEPVTVYAAVISLMVLSALATLFRSDWPPVAAVLAAVGAVLFFCSDALLAWNRFVTPVRSARLLVIVAYHLGQMALIFGVALRLFPAHFGVMA